MKISHDTATANMHKIKRHLDNGLLSVSVEYPCFLVIEYNGLEFHSGYGVEWDESRDQENFVVYEYTDGYNIGRTIEIDTPDNFEDLAGFIAVAVFTLVDENRSVRELALAL